jgi:nucleoside phosphorylase
VPTGIWIAGSDAPIRLPWRGTTRSWKEGENLLSTETADFVIVTALEDECNALLTRLPGWRQLPPTEDDIRVYFEAGLPVTGSTTVYRVIVLCVQNMGRVEAANATGDAIRRWSPGYVILVGIGGGVSANGVRLGDVLIADQVVDFELQKLTKDGPEIRWQLHRADPRLLGFVTTIVDSEWLSLINAPRPTEGHPKRHRGPIATGDKVIANQLLAKYRRRDVWPKLIGVEMEAGGVASAAFQAASAPRFFMIRGVSDLADPQKDTAQAQGWRQYACEIAASFAIALLRKGPVPLRATEIKTSSQKTNSDAQPGDPISQPNLPSGTSRVTEAIVLVHGIRTFANWYPTVKRVLEDTPGTFVIPIKFGYVDTFRFWCPLFTRSIPINDVRREIQNVQREHPDAAISVIAHSFGTYAICCILKDTPNLILHRLVLCGSIVNRRFRWEHVGLQVKTKILNDCGTRDCWPVLAKCLSWGYGDTGRHGFGRAAVHDRTHDFAHSDFFSEAFVRDYWKPWFAKGRLIPSAWEERAPASPWWIILLSILPLQWIASITLLALLALAVVRSSPSIVDKPPPSLNELLSEHEPPFSEGQAPRLSLEVLKWDAAKQIFTRVAQDGILRSRDQYALVVRPGTAGYLYVFQVDSGGKINWYFPKNDDPDSSGTNPVPGAREVVIPSSGTEGLALDDRIGTEQIVAVLSTARWESLEHTLNEVRVRQTVVQFSARTRGSAGTQPLAKATEMEILGKQMRFQTEELQASRSFLQIVHRFEHK